MKTRTVTWKMCRVFAAGFALLGGSVALPFLCAASENAALKGEMAYARITVGGRSHEVSPNQVGRFDGVSNIQPLATSLIEVAYPEGQVGQPVVIEVLDAGTLDNGKQVDVLPLDANRRLSFRFQVSEQPGTYEVTLRKGTDLKVIQLWVGPERPLARNDASPASPEAGKRDSRGVRASAMLRTKRLASSSALKVQGGGKLGN